MMKAALPLITIGLAATPIAFNNTPAIQDETVEGRWEAELSDWDNRVGVHLQLRTRIDGDR